MLNIATIERIKDRFEEIESQEDFDELMTNYKSSALDVESKEEAMEMLKKEFPQFDESSQTPTEIVAQMIKEGQSDISDMGGY